MRSRIRIFSPSKTRELLSAPRSSSTVRFLSDGRTTSAAAAATRAMAGYSFATFRPPTVRSKPITVHRCSERGYRASLPNPFPTGSAIAAAAADDDDDSRRKESSLREIPRSVDDGEDCESYPADSNDDNNNNNDDDDDDKEYSTDDERERMDGRGGNARDRIWMDPETSLERRVGRFVNQPLGSMHHLDVKLTSVDLIRECGKLDSFEGMKKAQEILDRLIDEKHHANANVNFNANANESDERGGVSPVVVVVPDRPFEMVMYGWANMCQTVKIAPQRMREVLELMIEESEYDKRIRKEVGASRIRTSTATSTATTTATATATATAPGSNTAADDDDAQPDDPFEGFSCEPTVNTYNTLLQGLSRAASRSIQAAIEAEHVLKAMDRANRNRGWHTKPNTRSYSLVLNAYARTRHATAGDRAESVLRAMIERHEIEREEYLEDHGFEYECEHEYEYQYEHEHDHEPIDPDAATTTTTTTTTNRRKIVTPDTVAYTTVIKAHGNSDAPDSARKALALLGELISSENPDLEPDAFAFANTIHAFARMAARKKSPRDRVEAAERAEDVLWTMVDEIRRREDPGRLTGSIVPFNACLNAWAKSFAAESPHRAEDLLRRMLDPELREIAGISPDAVSFNTCMQAWARACKFGDAAAPEKAEELLDLLIRLSGDDENENENDAPNPGSEGNRIPRPDVRSYVTVMNAYALSRNGDGVSHARRLFSDLLTKARWNHRETTGKSKKEQRIDASPFTIVLKAAANAKPTAITDDSEAEDRAFGSLADDDDDDGGPSAVDPYAIALETYSELLNDTHDLGVTADHFAFAEMLAVIETHTSPESIERRQRVEEIFRDARSAGGVSALVVRALQTACPNESMLRELLRLRGNDSVASIESVNGFPRQWTARVPQEFRRVSSRSEHFRKQSEFFRGTKANGRKKGRARKGSSESRR